MLEEEEQQQGDQLCRAVSRLSDCRISTWASDELLSCMLCGPDGTFGMLRRRHHCRKCGRLVCSTCAANFRRIRKGGFTHGTPTRPPLPVVGWPPIARRTRPREGVVLEDTLVMGFTF